jgi:multiple sugar transport system permease protein
MLVLPACLFVVAFLVYPIMYTFYVSLYDYSPLRSAVPHYVGLDNYRWLFGSDLVRQSLTVTLAFTVASVAVEMVVGLLVAELLARFMLGARSRFAISLSKILSGVFILPFATPAVAAAVAWKMLLHPQFSPVNAVLGRSVAWFTRYPLQSVVVIDAWKMTPLVLFLLLAAIMSIEPAQFEAAKMDGASSWQEFRYITLPSILPVVAVTVAFRAVDAFTKIFDIVYMTTGGGPGNATEVFPLLIWKTAFSHLRFGQASALAVVAVLISALLGGILLVRRGAV